LLVADIDFLRKAAKASRPLKIKKESNQRKNAGNTNSYGMTGKQNVEMVWTRRTHGR